MKLAAAICLFLAVSDAALSSRQLLSNSGNVRSVTVAQTSKNGADFNEGRSSSGSGGGDSKNAGCGNAGDPQTDSGDAMNTVNILSVLQGPSSVFVGVQVEMDSCWTTQSSVVFGGDPSSRNFEPEVILGSRPTDQGGIGETGVQGATSAGTEVVQLSIMLGEYWNQYYCFGTSVTIECAWEGDPIDQQIGITGVGITMASAVTNAANAMSYNGVSAGSIDALYGYYAGKAEADFQFADMGNVDYDRYMQEQHMESMYDDWMADKGSDFGFSSDSFARRRRVSELAEGRAVGGKGSEASGDEAVQVQYPDRIIVLKTNGGAGDQHFNGDFCLGHYVSWKTAMGFFPEVISVKDQNGDGDLVTEIYVTVSNRYHTAGVAAAYLQLIGDEPEMHQPWLGDYLKNGDSWGDVFTDSGYTMMDGMHPDDFFADLGVGRFSVNSGSDLCTMVWNGIRHDSGRFNGAPVAGAYSKYSSDNCISDKDAIQDGLSYFSNAGISTNEYCQYGEGSCGTWSALMSAFGKFTIGFHLGHGFEEQLSEPLIDGYAWDAIANGRSSGDCPGIMIALACYTGGVVCPLKDYCPGHKVLSEYVATKNGGHWSAGNGVAAWYGSTGAAAWDPPIAMINVLAALWAESQTRGGNLHETSGRKTAGAAIAAAAAIAIDEYGCMGPQCESDQGGGMTALQFVLNGDGAMFVSAVAGTANLGGDPFVAGDTAGINLSGNGGERATCVFSGNGNKSPPLVGVTSTGGAAKVAGADSIHSFGGNRIMLCHGYGLRSRSWVHNEACGGFRSDGQFGDNQVHVCAITGAQGGGQRCASMASRLGLTTGAWDKGCAGDMEFDLYEWLSGDIYDNFGGGSGRLSQDMLVEHFGGPMMHGPIMF